MDPAIHRSLASMIFRDVVLPKIWPVLKLNITDHGFSREHEGFAVWQKNSLGGGVVVVGTLFSHPEYLGREKILHLLPKERTGFDLNASWAPVIPYAIQLANNESTMTQILSPVCVTASTCPGWWRTRAPPQPVGTQGLVVLHALKGTLTWKHLFIVIMTWNLRLKINFPRSVTIMSQDNDVKFLKVKKFITRNHCSIQLLTLLVMIQYTRGAIFSMLL